MASNGFFNSPFAAAPSLQDWETKRRPADPFLQSRSTLQSDPTVPNFSRDKDGLPESVPYAQRYPQSYPPLSSSSSSYPPKQHLSDGMTHHPSSSNYGSFPQPHSTVSLDLHLPLQLPQMHLPYRAPGGLEFLLPNSSSVAASSTRQVPTSLPADWGTTGMTSSSWTSSHISFDSSKSRTTLGNRDDPKWTFANHTDPQTGQPWSMRGPSVEESTLPTGMRPWPHYQPEGNESLERRQSGQWSQNVILTNTEGSSSRGGHLEDGGRGYRGGDSYDYDEGARNTIGEHDGRQGSFDPTRQSVKKVGEGSQQPTRNPALRKYACHLCITSPRSFARPSALKIHMLTHTKEKPHICPTCSRAFAISSNLKRHSRLHEAA